MTQISALTPKLKPLSARKTKTVCVLDIGSSKISCLIAKLKPADPSEVFASRTHKVEVLGFGQSRADGIKSGSVINPELAEKAIRKAVFDAETQMGEQVEGVILALTSSQLQTNSWNAQINVARNTVEDKDIYRLMEVASNHDLSADRLLIHAIPSSYSLDNESGIFDPRGMLGKELSVKMNMVSCDLNTARNLMLVVEKCHLTIEAVVASPYAAGLSVLTDDEAEIGTTCIDFGAGITSIAVFANGRLIDSSSISMGAKHITNDIARGLSISFDEAERIKVLHGGVLATKSDERESFNIRSIGEDMHDLPHAVTRSQLIEIIRPRVDEILELVQMRLSKMSLAGESNKRLVITGGGSLLTGLIDLTGKTLEKQVRLGRPMGVIGLSQQAKSPAFSVLTGLAIYPQFAGLEHYEITSPSSLSGAEGYLGHKFKKTLGWIKESF